MEFFMKLPRSRREFALFMAIISIISVNIIAPLITCFEMGFHLYVWADALRIIPFIWLSVIVLVLLAYKPAEWMTGRIIREGDSFNAHIIVNILCTVFLMSIFLTVIGTWIGSRRISVEPIRLFFYKWPRNFSISLAVEALIAQPVARFVMLKLHQWMEAAAAAAVVRCMHQKRARNLGSLALFWNLPIPPLPGSRIFHGKMLPRHPEGADLRENRLAFRGKAACRHPCEPLPANDALGNGVQMEIVPLSRRAGACPSRDAETLERAREPSLALFSLYKWRVHDVYPENVNKLQPLFWMGYCYKSS